MRSAIVTGANGFVGSEIVRNLVNHGFNVYALYNRSKNRLETIEKCRTVHCPMDQFSKIPEKSKTVLILSFIVPGQALLGKIVPIFNSNYQTLLLLAL